VIRAAAGPRVGVAVKDAVAVGIRVDVDEGVARVGEAVGVGEGEGVGEEEAPQEAKAAPRSAQAARRSNKQAGENGNCAPRSAPERPAGPPPEKECIIWRRMKRLYLIGIRCGFQPFENPGGAPKRLAYWMLAF
jgi:hypothetical protein